MMQACRPVLWALTLSGVVTSAVAATPWERWIARPTPASAQQVQRIEYSIPGGNADLGEETTRDLRTLAARVGQGDPASLAIAVRLVHTTRPGAHLEDLHAMLGRASGDHAQRFLAALRQEGGDLSCPGVEFMGEAFVDNDAAKVAERERRRRALMKVSSTRLVPVRDRCLKVLQQAG